MTAAETLFSLEVVVERLFVLPQLPCRFPEIAVKLLDFPAFTIDYLEPGHAQMLRDKLTIDPLYTVGPQILELKHNDGSFYFGKGKSCLCRISPDDLRVHLANSPMYVLVLDAFSKPPRLVGSCIVPLTAAIDHIHDELLKEGVSVPATYGEQRLLRVSNLMGSDIGEIAIAYRLTSLGAVLLSHIHLPNHDVKVVDSVTKPGIVVGRDSTLVVEATLSKDNLKQQSLEIHDQLAAAVADQVALAARSAERPMVHPPEAAAVARSTHGTQTKAPVSSPGLMIEYDDYIVNGMFCPPPLYYYGITGDDAASFRPSGKCGDSPRAASSRSGSSGSCEGGNGGSGPAVRPSRWSAVHAGSRTAGGGLGVSRGDHRAARTDARERQRAAESRACQAELGCLCRSAQGDVTAAFASGTSTDLSSLSAHFPILGSLVTELLKGLQRLPLVQPRASLTEDLQNFKQQLQAASEVAAGALGTSERLEERSPAGEPNESGGNAVAGRSLPLGAAEPSGSAAALATVPGERHRAQKPAAPHVRRGGSMTGIDAVGGSGGGGKLTWGSTRTQKLRLQLTNPRALQWQESHEWPRRRQPSTSAELPVGRERLRQPMEEEARPEAAAEHGTLLRASDAGLMLLPGVAASATHVASARAAGDAAGVTSSCGTSQAVMQRQRTTGLSEHDNRAAANTRTSLDVRVPVVRPPSSTRGGSENAGSSDGRSTEGDRDVGNRSLSDGGSMAHYSGAELVPSSQGSEVEDRYGTELEDIEQYRLELSRLAATAAATAAMTNAFAAKVPTTVPPVLQKKDGFRAHDGPMDAREKRGGALAVAATAAASGISARSGQPMDNERQHQQQQEMPQIAEHSEPEGSYTDSFDSDISKSVSLPIMADASDGESSHKLVGVSQPLADLPLPRTSQGSPTQRGRPANPPLSRSNPALRSSSQQEGGKPPLSGRSRGGGMGSADSSRATSGRSASRGGGGAEGQQPTPDAGDSDSSFRALRARNEERRKRLSRSFKDDMNTDSVSSYDPSEKGQGRSSGSPAASEDWSSAASSSGAGDVKAMTLSRLAPANRLGYTT